MTVSLMDFGDLKLFCVDRDRFYNTDKNTYGKPNKKYSDKDYTSNGYYYGNGTGGEKRRYVVIDDVKAGDVLIAFTGWTNTPSGNGDTITCLSGSFSNNVFTADGIQNENSDLFNSVHKSVFVAKKDGAYKIYTNSANGGKPLFFRFIRVPSITVTGTITGEIPSVYGIKFQNQSTGDEIAAEINGNVYSAVLPVGYKYTAMMSGVTGYGFTIATKNIETKFSDTSTGKVQNNLVSERKPSYTLNGLIVGLAENYDIEKLAFTFTPTDNTEASAVNAIGRYKCVNIFCCS